MERSQKSGSDRGALRGPETPRPKASEIEASQNIVCGRRVLGVLSRSTTGASLADVPEDLAYLACYLLDEGHYSTEDEVVADGLRLMQARDDVAEIKRTRLRGAIERGYEDAAAGKVIRLEINDEIDALFAEL